MHVYQTSVGSMKDRCCARHLFLRTFEQGRAPVFGFFCFWLFCWVWDELAFAFATEVPPGVGLDCGSE